MQKTIVAALLPLLALAACASRTGEPTEPEGQDDVVVEPEDQLKLACTRTLSSGCTTPPPPPPVTCPAGCFYWGYLKGPAPGCYTFTSAGFTPCS